LGFDGGFALCNGSSGGRRLLGAGVLNFGKGVLHHSCGLLDALLLIIVEIVLVVVRRGVSL